MRKRSEAARGIKSVQDSNTLPTRTSNRSATRQACIGDMEEELHHAFAMARYVPSTIQLSSQMPCLPHAVQSSVLAHHLVMCCASACFMAGYQGGQILSTSEIMTRTPDWTHFVAGIRYSARTFSFSVSFCVHVIYYEYFKYCICQRPWIGYLELSGFRASRR